jgi:hypothetical protein
MTVSVRQPYVSGPTTCLVPVVQAGASWDAGGTPYLLYDDFAAACAAGSVNGTPVSFPASVTIAGAVPRRTVTDTESKLSIAGGVLTFAGGKASSANGDPGIWYPAVTRVAGRLVLVNLRLTAEQNVAQVGFDTDQSGSVRDGACFEIRTSGVALRAYSGGAGLDNVGAALSTATDYKFAVVLRSSGAYFLMRGGTLTTWTLVGIMTIATTSPLYPIVSNNNAAFTADNLRIPTRLWLPTPTAYDAFTRANGAIGSSDVLGPDSQAVAARVWTGATWTIATNKAVNTPTLGAEDISNGGFETGDPPTGWTPNAFATPDGVADERTGGAGAQSLSILNNAANYGYVTQVLDNSSGTWVRLSGWGKNVTGTPGLFMLRTGAAATISLVAVTTISWVLYAITGRLRDVGSIALLAGNSAILNNESRYDDVSVKPLTLASLFASVTDATTSDVIVSCTVAALTTGTQAGLVARLNDTTTPTAGIIAYFDGVGNVNVDEFTTATTWTNLISAAKAFTASDKLRLDLSGNAIRCYHVTAAGVATLIGTATATANTNTKHGLFSTDSGNTFTMCAVWPKGAGGAHEGLSAL